MYEIPQSLSMERSSERTFRTRGPRLGWALMRRWTISVEAKGARQRSATLYPRTHATCSRTRWASEAKDSTSDLCLDEHPTADELEGVGEREQSLQLLKKPKSPVLPMERPNVRAWSRLGWWETGGQG